MTKKPQHHLVDKPLSMPSNKNYSLLWKELEEMELPKGASMVITQIACAKEAVMNLKKPLNKITAKDIINMFY